MVIAYSLEGTVIYLLTSNPMGNFLEKLGQTFFLDEFLLSLLSDTSGHPKQQQKKKTGHTLLSILLIALIMPQGS